MRWPARSLVALAALAAGCSSTGPGSSGASPASRPATAMEVVDAAVKALGGRAAVEAASTLVMDGTGQAFYLGQGREPDGGPLGLEITRFRRVIDLAAGRWRDEADMTPRYQTGFPAPRKMITAVDGDVGFDVAADGTATRVGPADARDRRSDLRHSPLGILRAALAPGATVSNRRRAGRRDEVDIRTADGATFTLVVDPASGLPAQVRSMTDQPNLGDVAIATEFAEYRPAGALVLPTLITQRLDRHVLSVLRVSRSVAGGQAPHDLAALEAPASVRSASPAPPAPRVTVDELARGVWLLHGEEHHSVLVEFADHLTLIEAPMDEARTRAVIEKARQLQPARPLTHVVMTHHHFDHSGGLRAAVAEGLTVIAHEKSAAFVEDMVARRHTIAPDALARNPRPLTLELVSGRMVLRDSLRAMELHAVDTGHASTMLVAYMPAERLLVQVDLYTAPGEGAPTWYPFAAPLVRAVRAQKMNVDRVVPLHRSIVSFADVVAAAEKPEPQGR